MPSYKKIQSNSVMKDLDRKMSISFLIWHYIETNLECEEQLLHFVFAAKAIDYSENLQNSNCFKNNFHRSSAANP